MNSDADWAGQAQRFQQDLAQQWTKALQHLQPAAEGAGTAPHLGFAPDKLQALQQAYVREACELWNAGLSTKPVADKRFAGDAWARNPVAAFSAALYLLNART